MAFSSCLCHFQLPNKIEHPKQISRRSPKLLFYLKSNNTELFGKRMATTTEAELMNGWSFVGGSTITIRPKLEPHFLCPKRSGVYASWLTSSEIASDAFAMGTVGVLPFYVLMVVAPKANLTRTCMESSLPYVALGLVYAYLVYMSWTPESLRLLFTSKYWLPELPGIHKMFASELTLSSGWIHCLAIDLFAARHVFLDGLENEIETRHSVFLCLLCCPIGIATHIFTKALTHIATATEPQKVVSYMQKIIYMFSLAFIYGYFCLFLARI